MDPIHLSSFDVDSNALASHIRPIALKMGGGFLITAINFRPPVIIYNLKFSGRLRRPDCRLNMGGILNNGGILNPISPDG